MARHTEIFKITKENRDTGKSFLITEPSAIRGEAIFTEAAALCDGEISLQGLLSQMTTSRGKEFWNGLLNMVEFLPTGEGGLKRKIGEEDIEEISTLMDLKRGVLNMILGFPVTYSPLNTEVEIQQK